MFKFKDLSDKNIDFNSKDHLLTSKQFFEKRRTSKKIHLFDLRSSEDFEKFHIPGAHNLPFDQFEDSIYRMPFSDEFLLYGNSEKEILKAAEMLYENGFEYFYCIGSLESLMSGVDASFVKISKKAYEHISKFILNSDEKLNGVSIIVDPKMDRKANYIIKFIKFSDTFTENITIDFGNFNLLVSNDSIPYLEGTEIDLNDEGILEVFNPDMTITQISGTVENQIKHILEEEVNPMIAAHGGIVSLLEVKDKNVYLEFGGGCQGCGMIDVTLKQGVEVMIKEHIPEIETIYDVTDHAGGTNPYYQPSEK